jgi:hypothetical protein
MAWIGIRNPRLNWRTHDVSSPWVMCAVTRRDCARNINLIIKLHHYWAILRVDRVMRVEVNALPVAVPADQHLDFLFAGQDFV